MPGLLQAHRGTSSEAAARAIAATSSSAQAHHGQPDPELLAEIGGGCEVGMVTVYRMDYFGIDPPESGLTLLVSPVINTEAIAVRSQSAIPRPSCTLERSSSTGEDDPPGAVLEGLTGSRCSWCRPSSASTGV